MSRHKSESKKKKNRRKKKVDGDHQTIKPHTHDERKGTH